MRKSLAALGIVLSVAGFIIFIALGIGAWFAKREADRQFASGMEKAHRAGEVAERVIVLIREVIARAKTSLTAARAETQPKGDVSDPMVRIAIWKAKRELPGEVEKARDAVGVASEAVIVAESFLDVFVEHKPDETALGVNASDIHAARSQLESAASDLRNARTVLGVPIATATAEQYSQIDRALSAATDMTNRVDAALKDAKTKVGAAKSSADRWSLWIAVIATALAALAAVGQVFLYRASRRAYRGVPA